MCVELISLADEARAPTIANDARRMPMHASTLAVLCARLGHHLHELQYALARTRQQNHARLKAVGSARAIAEQQLDAMAHVPDPVRTLLLRSLSTERTRFVMSTKVDALVELDTKIEDARRIGAARTAARTAPRAIVDALLEVLWGRLVPQVHAPITGFTTRLRHDLESSLAELGEPLHGAALVGIEQPRLGTFHDALRRTELPTPLATWLGLVTGRRAETAAREELSTLLVDGAKRLGDRLLDHYDHALVATESRFRDRLDAIEASVTYAGIFATDARRLGEEGVTHARHRLLAWSSMLATIAEQLRSAHA